LSGCSVLCILCTVASSSFRCFSMSKVMMRLSESLVMGRVVALLRSVGRLCSWVIFVFFLLYFRVIVSQFRWRSMCVLLSFVASTFRVVFGCSLCSSRASRYCCLRYY